MEANQIRVPQELLKRSTQTFQSGEVIFKEGDLGDSLYIVLQGDVEILKRTDKGVNRLLAQLRPGDIMGEMALLDSLPRSATAVAKGRTELLVIREEGFLTLMSKNPQFALKIMKSLTKKIRDSNKIISDFHFSLAKWIQSGLHRYSKEAGEKISGGWKFSRKAFEKWAAAHLGVTPREMLGALHQLRNANHLWVAPNGDDMVLKPAAMVAE